MRKLRNKIGNPVTGDDFWPRPDVVDPLLDDIVNDRGSRRMFALRRIGKTSVLLELERRLRLESGLRIVRIDAQGLSRFKDFLNKLFEQLPTPDDKLGTARSKLMRNSAIQSLLPGLWARLTGTPAAQSQSFTNEFEHSAAWAGDIEAALVEAGPIVLMIDELPYMLRHMTRSGYTAHDAERFLAMLRSWRMSCGVRIVLSGSIGLAQLKRSEGIHVGDVIGDVHPVHVPPLLRDDAIAMVDALARGEGAGDWSRPLSEAVVDACAETWPIFLQFGFRAVMQTSAPRDPAGIKAAVEAGVRRALDENFYEQFSVRLSRYGDDERAARLVLKTIVAADPGAVAFKAIDEALEKCGAGERRDDLLEALREDDFIVFDTEPRTARAASRLVPIWVRARAWGR